MSREFSDNVLIGGNFAGLPESKDKIQQIILAEQIALSEGCPISGEVIRASGPEKAIMRYGEIIFTRQLILESAKANNPSLYEQLVEDIPRDQDEPVGTFETNAILFSDHLSTITANNTPWGWSAPRLVIEIFGSRETRTQKTVLQGLNIADIAIQTSVSPVEFLAKLADLTSTSGVMDETVLKRTLSSAYLEEENTKLIYQKLTEQLKDHAPDLWNKYISMSPNHMEQLGIAHPDSFNKI